MLLRVAGVTLAGLLPVLVLNGQQQPLRSGVELVELDVVVLDKQRHPVRGLVEQDFTILEDGKRRAIVGFAAVDLLRSPSGDGRQTERTLNDIFTNDRPERGRLIVIAFDRSIPAGPATDAAKTIARSAIDALGPDDLAAVVRTSGFANEGKSQNFTRDRTLLLDAAGSDFIGLVNPPVMGILGLRAGPAEMRLTGDCPCGLCSLESLQRIASALSGVRDRQKLILFIASDIVISDEVSRTGPCAGRTKPAREAALRALDRANVTVHAIDPVGLAALTSGVGAAELGFQSVSRAIQARQANLAVLPAYTGGRLVRNTNAPGDIVPAIFMETSSYYLVGFERGGSGSDAKQRSMKVHVNRPDVTVVARKAYYSASPSAEKSVADPLEDSVSGVLPASGIRMAMSLAAVFTPSGDVKTDVLVDVIGEAPDRDRNRATPTHDEPQTKVATFDLLVGVFDERARPVLTKQLPLAPVDTCVTGLCAPTLRLDLKPGRYEIRVGAIDRAASRRGSVYGYIEVPAIDPEALSLSDPQIATSLTGALPAPTVRRTFRAEEHLAIFTYIRRPLNSTTPVSVRAAVADTKGNAVANNSTLVDRGSFSHAGVSEVRIAQSLSKFPPGTYTIAIEARHLDRIVQREIAFEVR